MSASRVAKPDTGGIDEGPVVEALRSEALALIEEMLALIAEGDNAQRVLDQLPAASIHEALVALVMRAIVRVGAAARGLSSSEGRLFDDMLCPLLDNAAVRRTVGPAEQRAEEVFSCVEVPSGGGRVPYDQLPVEVIGSLYEGLIARGVVRDERGRLQLLPTRGRKRSGSYYTPRPITREVVTRALAPALQRLAARPAEQRVRALLSLRFCDPAMGAGAFLIETARQLARELARARAEAGGEGEAGALRDVVPTCLYGCDISPVAVAVAEASLWMLVGDPRLPPNAVGCGLYTGDALIGMLKEDLERLSVLLPSGGDEASAERAAAAVALCADPGRLSDAADHVVGATLGRTGARRTQRAAAQSRQEAIEVLRGRAVSELASRARAHGAFHWPLSLPPAASAHGFDAVVGNPPWVAFAGRAAQPLDPAVREYFASCYEAWRGYPTLHGLFVERASRLAPHGVVALVVPSPLADLEGYRAVRRALSRRHQVREPLLEFGQDAFSQVVQPCIALVADPTSDQRSNERAWRLEERQHAAAVACSIAPPRVLQQLVAGPSLPAETFREMGFQTSARVTRTMLRRSEEPDAVHRVPLLEGRNVQAFFVGEPRLFLAADPERLAAARARLRPIEQYRTVDFVVRQTAPMPIAAMHTGLPFRNTLLAGFAQPELESLLLVGLLNSALYRAIHLAARRDARQAAFPQVKISHLRQLPLPPDRTDDRERVAAIASDLGIRAAASGGAVEPSRRSMLDAAVFDLFCLIEEQRGAVLRFLAERAPKLGYAP